MYDQLEIFVYLIIQSLYYPPCENERISPEKKGPFQKKIVFQPTFFRGYCILLMERIRLTSWGWWFISPICRVLYIQPVVGWDFRTINSIKIVSIGKKKTEVDSFISDSSGLEVEKQQFYISKTAEIGSLSMFIPIIYQGFVHPTGAWPWNFLKQQICPKICGHFDDFLWTGQWQPAQPALGSLRLTRWQFFFNMWRMFFL